jgi:hypothetical protein
MLMRREEETTTGVHLILAKRQPEAPKRSFRWARRIACFFVGHRTTPRSLPFCSRCGKLTDTSF